MYEGGGGVLLVKMDIFLNKQCTIIQYIFPPLSVQAQQIVL